MSALKFEPLPDSAGGPSHKWSRVAAELKTNPGAWARIAEQSSSSNATNMRNGVIAAFRPVGQWEFVTRNTRDRNCDIWARYIGEVEA